jgi:hypothetical protein
MPIRSLSLLFCLFLGLAAHSSASDWAGVDAGYSDDYRRAAISGSGDLAPGWVLQGADIESSAQLAGQTDWTRASQGLLGLGYRPLDFLNMGLNGTFGGDSTGARFGGGSAELGGQLDEDGTTTGLTVHGGTLHYLFSPDQSLRQNSAGALLSFKLGDWLGLNAGADTYGYNRDLAENTSTSKTTSDTLLNGLSLLPGGLPGSSMQSPLASMAGGSTAPEALTDPLLPGFPDRDGVLSLTVDPGLGAELALVYSPTHIVETDAWDQMVGASWRQNLGGDWSAKAAWTKALAHGDGSPYFNLALVWAFLP